MTISEHESNLCHSCCLNVLEIYRSSDPTPGFELLYEGCATYCGAAAHANTFNLHERGYFGWTFLGTQNGSNTNPQMEPLHLTVEMGAPNGSLGVPWGAPWALLGGQNGSKTNRQVGPLHLTVEMGAPSGSPSGAKTKCQVGPLHLTFEMAAPNGSPGVPWAAPWAFLGAQNRRKTKCQVGPLHLTFEMGAPIGSLGVPWGAPISIVRWRGTPPGESRGGDGQKS